MLTLVFVVTVVTGIVAYQLLVVRPRERRRGVQAAGGAVSGWVDWLPPELSLQPQLTWTRRAAGGDVLLGVHPLLLGLIGGPRELDVVARDFVAVGDPLIRVRRGDRSLTLLSPITGALREIAQPGRDAGPQRSGSEGTAWFCRFESSAASEAETSWFSGERGRDWLRDRYRAMRDFVQRLAMDQELGQVLADGGELPIGALGELDAADWRDFELAFLRK